MEQAPIGLSMYTALDYLDDVTVPRHSFSQEIADLHLVFEQLKKAKLSKKYVLFQR